MEFLTMNLSKYLKIEMSGVSQGAKLNWQMNVVLSSYQKCTSCRKSCDVQFFNFFRNIIQSCSSYVHGSSFQIFHGTRAGKVTIRFRIFL